MVSGKQWSCTDGRDITENGRGEDVPILTWLMYLPYTSPAYDDSDVSGDVSSPCSTVMKKMETGDEDTSLLWKVDFIRAQ